MILGQYLGCKNSSYLESRKTVLSGRANYGRILTYRDANTNFSEHEIKNDLCSQGYSAVLLARDEGDKSLTEKFKILGNPLLELENQGMAEESTSYILNLKCLYSSTTNKSLQPFSGNALTLHTEHSARPVEVQPKYIVLYCVNSGHKEDRVFTIMQPIDQILSVLSPAVVKILKNTRYNFKSNSPQIIRVEKGRKILAFRDFMDEPLPWICTVDGVTEQDVNNSIESLINSMYVAVSLTAIAWSTGLAVVFDNTRFLHGRTQSEQTVASNRNLKRLKFI